MNSTGSAQAILNNMNTHFYETMSTVCVSGPSRFRFGFMKDYVKNKKDAKPAVGLLRDETCA